MTSCGRGEEEGKRGRDREQYLGQRTLWRQAISLGGPGIGSMYVECYGSQSDDYNRTTVQAVTSMSHSILGSTELFYFFVSIEILSIAFLFHCHRHHKDLSRRLLRIRLQLSHH